MGASVGILRLQSRAFRPARVRAGLPDEVEGAPDDGQQSRPGRRGQCRCRVAEHRDHHEGLACCWWPDSPRSAPGSEPPLNQTVGHCAGSSPMPPLLADRMEPRGASAGWAASCCSPAKARQMSSGEANHSRVSMSRGGPCQVCSCAWLKRQRVHRGGKERRALARGKAQVPVRQRRIDVISGGRVPGWSGTARSARHGLTIAGPGPGPRIGPPGGSACRRRCCR